MNSKRAWYLLGVLGLALVMNARAQESTDPHKAIMDLENQWLEADKANNPDMIAAAIARGGYKGSGTEPSGKPFTEHLRWTDTWVKMPSGKWQVVATQYTPIKG